MHTTVWLLSTVDEHVLLWVTSLCTFVAALITAKELISTIGVHVCLEVTISYRLRWLFRGFLAPGYIARYIWLYSQELYSQIYLAI